MVALSCASWTVVTIKVHALEWKILGTVRSQLSVDNLSTDYPPDTGRCQSWRCVELPMLLALELEDSWSALGVCPGDEWPCLPHSQGAKLHLTKSQVRASFRHRQSCCPSSVHRPGEAIKEHPAHPCSGTAITLSPSTEALGIAVHFQPRVSLPVVQGGSAELPNHHCTVTALATGTRPGHIHLTLLALDNRDMSLIPISSVLKRLTMHSSCLMAAKGYEHAQTDELLLQQPIYTLQAHVSQAYSSLRSHSQH